MQERLPFNKPAISIQDQLALLEQRGLIVADRERAAFYLNFIGYYRLSGYFYPFQEKSKGVASEQFLPDTHFDTVLSLYIFDRELRLLVMDALERIEVAVRVRINQVMSMQDGPHWYMNPSRFTDAFQESGYEQILEDIKVASGYYKPKRSKPNKSDFCGHYYAAYNKPQLPPCWMVAEIMPLSNWSRIFANLRFREDQKEICRPFDLHFRVMTSWLHALSFLRNLCQHQQRLWNRSFTIKPMQAREWAAHFRNNGSLYAQLAMLQVFMHRITEKSQWGMRLFGLLYKYPAVPPDQLGFPDNWYKDSLWDIY
ncbi:MAG: Abi family protein [Acidobacteriota bacterium]|nr:Abi family protein [Acidobacteriota bacterium]